MSEATTGMAWGDLRETSAVMSAGKGRHDDFCGWNCIKSNNNIFKNGEGRSAWVVGSGRGMRRVGKGQKQIRCGHWNSNSFIAGNQCLVKMPFSSTVV
jgi:hypothetical protein